MNKKNALRILVGAPLILIVGAIFLWKPIILIGTSMVSIGISLSWIAGGMLLAVLFGEEKWL